MMQTEEYGSDVAQVIDGVLEGTQAPVWTNSASGHLFTDEGAEFHQRHHKNDAVYGIEQNRPHGEEFLDEVTASKRQVSYDDEHDQDTYQVGKAEIVSEKDASRRADDCQDNDKIQDIDDLKDKPKTPQQNFEKRPIVVGTEDTRKFEGDGKGNRADQCREDDAKNSTQWAVRKEVFNDFPSGSVSAGNDHRLEDETGKQVFFKKGRVREIE